MTTPITLENSFCKFTFLKAPKQVKKPADLPNWFITLADKHTQQAVKTYMQIQYDPCYPVDMQDSINTVDYIKALLTDSTFTAQFGELVLNGVHQKSPLEDETYRVVKEFHNFFQRRGRNVRSIIETVPGKKFNPITLSLDSDTTFITTQSHMQLKRNYKCISGTVTILGQHQHFQLCHPLFDLSILMTAGDARKTIISGLRKAFPFMDVADIQDWAFDNQVHGK